MARRIWTHKSVQEYIHDELLPEYEVWAEAIKRIDGKKQIRLPDWESDIYRPDVVVKSKTSGDILHVIEVENDPMRKSVMGASLLAHNCFGLMPQKTRSSLTFIVFSEKGITQMDSFIKRCEIASS